MPRCSGSKADGSPCERIVPEGVDLCYSHDPDRAQARRASASKAGRARGPVAELAELRAMVKRYMTDVEAGRLEEARVVEVGLKVREQEQLIERLEALEDALVERDGRRGWGA